MLLPQRKSTRLKDYDYGTPGAYFITICTHKRQMIFEAETVGNDLRVVPPSENHFAVSVQNAIIHNLVNETENKFTNIRIDKYVIMPDHIHMIIVITERHIGRSLQDVVHWFKVMTTNAYISGVKDGILKPFDTKLWQKSYHDHIIRNEKDYLETWKYIDENPLKP